MQRRFTYLSVLSVLIMLTACASAPTRFYTLSSPAKSATISMTPVEPVYIDMAAVNVPDRLARPQIVIRSDDARVDILEQDRWSAPLNAELRDALAGGLANRLNAIDVSRSGRPASAPVYRINVELRGLDAVRGSQVNAQFGWTITRSDSGKRAICRLSLLEPVVGVGIDTEVQGMQRAVDHAADAMAKNIAALRDGQADACSH